MKIQKQIYLGMFLLVLALNLVTSYNFNQQWDCSTPGFCDKLSHPYWGGVYKVCSDQAQTSCYYIPNVRPLINDPSKVQSNYLATDLTFNVASAGNYNCSLNIVETGHGYHDSAQLNETVAVYLNGNYIFTTQDNFCNSGNSCKSNLDSVTAVQNNYYFPAGSNTIVLVSGQSHALRSASINCEKINSNNGNNNQTNQTNQTNNVANINIIVPANSIYNSTPINLQVTSDQVMDNWIYSLNNGPYITFTPNNTNITPQNGLNYLVVYASNSNGLAFDEIYFTYVNSSNNGNNTCTVNCGGNNQTNPNPQINETFTSNSKGNNQNGKGIDGSDCDTSSEDIETSFIFSDSQYNSSKAINLNYLESYGDNQVSRNNSFYLVSLLLIIGIVILLILILGNLIIN